MQFTIWLTTECNMKCSYCYEGNDKLKAMMDKNIANDVLQFIKDKTRTIQDSIAIIFHGGEPLLNYEVIKYIILEMEHWDIESHFIMTTNGSKLDDEKIEFLVDHLDEISVSIDGNQDTQNKHRLFKDNSGSYEKIINSVKKLIKEIKGKETSLRARMTITTDTCNDLYDNIKFLYNMGFKIIVPVLDNSNTADWTSEHLETIVSSIKRCYEELYLEDDLMISLIEAISYKHLSDCRAGEVTMHISPIGEIYPCSYVMNNREFLLGDVNNGLMEDQIEKLRGINEQGTECRGNCAWYGLCNGTRCKLINYVQTGDYYKPSFCTCFNEKLQLAVNRSCKKLQPRI